MVTTGYLPQEGPKFHYMEYSVEKLVTAQLFLFKVTGFCDSNIHFLTQLLEHIASDTTYTLFLLLQHEYFLKDIQFFKAKVFTTRMAAKFLSK